jgi:hypothetical protein
MAKANVSGVAVGLKHSTNIYVKSASGNVYRMNPLTIKHQQSANKIGINGLIARIKERGTIDTKFFTKVKG